MKARTWTACVPALALVLCSIVLAPETASATACTATITAPTFATYYPLTTNATTADADTTQGSIALSCSSPANKTGTITISTSSPSMTGPSPSLTYTIDEPGAPSTPWTTSYAYPFSCCSTYTFAASINAGQAVKSGSYADSTTQFNYSYNGGSSATLGVIHTAVTVASECVFSNSTSATVAFSTPYAPLGTNSASGSDETTTWQGLYQCTQSDTTYKWSFASANASGTQMRMKSGATYMNYYVHDTGGVNFPSGTSLGASAQTSGSGYTTLAYDFTFGIPKGQNLTTGSYSDSNVVTLTP